MLLKGFDSMKDISSIGVVGAGPMGSGIAQIGLTGDMPVVLIDKDQSALDRAVQDINGRIARLVEKGVISGEQLDTIRGRLRTSTDIADLASCDVVIEAIVERLEPKQTLFRDLEDIVGEQCILATNTSSLSVAAIAAKCRNRSRVCGMHFFNPVPLMKLVEVVVAPGTSADVAEAAHRLSLRLGKVPVSVKDGPGFLVNLQGRAYTTEALAIAQEGVASFAAIDRIMRDGAGFRMGPFELMDLTGIDVNYPVTQFIYEGYQHDQRLRTTTQHALLAAAGNFGRKTGRGFFGYGEGGTETPVDMPVGGPALYPKLIGPERVWQILRAATELIEGGDVNLVAPVGEDCATICHRLGLDPANTVAIDFTAVERRHLTVMSAMGGSPKAEQVAQWLRGHGFMVETIQDSPGFVLQRILAMVANLGCELAQIGVGSPADIDTAMKLAQNYPLGPLEWAEKLGVATCHAILVQLQSITGSDRYRPSLWLRRRAMLGLSVYTPQ